MTTDDLTQSQPILEAARAYERAWTAYANPRTSPGLTEEDRILAKAHAHQALLEAVRAEVDGPPPAS